MAAFCDMIHSKLVVTTSDCSYEGMLKFISLPKQFATFEHVYELPSRDYLGTVHMSVSSILSWEVLESPVENFDASNFDRSQEVHSGEFVKHERIDCCSEIINIAPDKYFLDYLPLYLKSNCPTDFCIVDSINTDFYEAVKHLSESTNIGVSCHGPEVSREGMLTWMCLSTSTSVFLFDLERLGKSAFEKGLKEILEDEKIQKIIHDCREVVDCLLHLYDTELKHIFDTQVADYLINMQMCTGKGIFKYVNALDSCLFKYLRVPQQFLYNHTPSVIFSEEVDFYRKRPVSKDYINVLLKSSMYLIFLKEEQQKLLMSPYEQAVELSLDIVRKASDSSVPIMQSEDSLEVPSYLLESIKSINFCDPSAEIHRDDFDGENLSKAAKRKYLAEIRKLQK